MANLMGALAPIRCNVCHSVVRHDEMLWSNPQVNYDMCCSCHSSSPFHQASAQQHTCVLMTYQARMDQTLAMLLQAQAQAQAAQAAQAVQVPAMEPEPFILPPAPWMQPSTHPLNRRKQYRCWDRDGTVHVKSICPRDHEEFLRVMKTHTRIEELSPEEVEAQGLDSAMLL